jgi:aspartokinase/homoserine dehydrogenase 1
LPFEAGQIEIEPLLPQEALHWSAEEFMRRIAELDQYFEQKRSAAAARGERLFFAARIDCSAQRASISLQAVSAEHPFSALRGSDNIVAFTTARYNLQPLVVKGPGAGAAVTAAGVFSDIIRIGR